MVLYREVSRLPNLFRSPGGGIELTCHLNNQRGYLPALAGVVRPGTVLLIDFPIRR
ncbi:protein of unknown function [Candidatus Methylacidiphilum fumarolicum]|uniref:Uncharacterized protein n=1 Tax=Candidatus Methylacidiphilum fumarolicum TaxID=591154 RepID=A0ABM9IDB6_9BACT|nr:protein of unknown function [Candidatus Methylacidiphilum fumarolicum]